MKVFKGYASKKNQDFLVNEDQMSELITHPYWKQLINQNYLQKLEIGAINPEEVLFAESTLTEAVIGDCTDLTQLQELAKNAYTKKLKVLILNRVEELQTMLDELKTVFPKPQLSEVLKTGNIKEIKEAIERATLADIDTLKALMNDDRVEIKNAVAEKVQQLIDENR